MAPSVIAILLLTGCSDRPSVAVRATVETFYGAVQNDNLPLAEDNLAAATTPQFRQHVQAAAQAAQGGGAARSAVQLVHVAAPEIHDGTAHVQVTFADQGSDTVTLVREGLRWKVITSGRLG